MYAPFGNLLHAHCTTHASPKSAMARSLSPQCPRKAHKRVTQGCGKPPMHQQGAAVTVTALESALRCAKARGPRRHPFYQQPNCKHPTRCIPYQALAIPAPFSCLLENRRTVPAALETTDGSTARACFGSCRSSSFDSTRGATILRWNGFLSPWRRSLQALSTPSSAVGGW